jgi:hypothetical protein
MIVHVAVVIIAAWLLATIGLAAFILWYSRREP